MSAPWTFAHLFTPTRILSMAALYRRSPFDPQWALLLSVALGEPAIHRDDVAWSLGCAPSEKLDRIMPLLRGAVVGAAQELSNGASPDAGDLAVYQGAAVYCLWEEYAARIQAIIDRNDVDVPFYDAFVNSHRLLFRHPGLTVPEPAHLLAVFYQARRAWYFTASMILGSSPSAAAARLSIWRANLGGDVCTYADSLYEHMDEVPVLITGETGTGKDLAARSIGWSRYIPFDAGARRFVRRYADDFHVRNLSEVPGDLVASTLFGHKRGSFTGATADAPGLFALPGRHGSLFLDEAGDISKHIQAKLLRPLESREYVPLGETHPRELRGRLIFATNCDLEALCAEGRFRSDLLERMNGVHVQMPSLRQMIAEAPDEMRHYVRAFVAAKVRSPALVATWTERIMESIDANRGHPWRRNLRQLRNYVERCILSYGPEDVVPASPPAATSAPAETASAAAPVSTCLPSSGRLGPRAKAGEVSAGEITEALVKRVHELTGGNIAETARRTGLDRRTVMRLLDLPKSPSPPRRPPHAPRRRRRAP